MRRLLAILVLVAGSVLLLSSPASASQCATGPDLSRFGVQQIDYCAPQPF